MKQKSKSHWILTALRIVICVVAIVFLVRSVQWYDHVRLHDKDGPRVRLLEHTGDTFVIERDGARETLDASAVHYVTVRGQRIPDIELGMPSVAAQADRTQAALATLLVLPAMLILALRLKVMVGPQGMRLSYWNAVKLTFAGNFFNFALPGTTGGDLVKAYYLAQYTHQKTEVVATVFIDRMVGMFSLILVAAVAMLLAWDPEQFGVYVVFLMLLFSGLIVAITLVVSDRLRHALRIPQLAGRLPLSDQTRRVGAALLAYRRHPMHLLGALGLTVTLQCFIIISATLMGYALGMEGSFARFCTGVAIGFMIAAIPITPPQAIGVMEYFYVVFFTQGAINTPSQAVAMAVGARLMQLVWALPGVLVPLFGAHLPSQRELEQLESAQEAHHEASSALDPSPDATPAIVTTGEEPA
jgi:uncharacterized protein (TIRG00374 family)